MVSPFRIQLLVLSLSALAISLFLRTRWLVALAAFVLAVNATPAVLRTIERPVLPPEASGQPVSIVFSNVLTDNRHFDKVVQLIGNEDPDIFAAAETAPAWIENLSPLHDRYAYRYAPDLGIFGLAIYAKRPFSAEVFELGTRGMTVARADFGDFILYVAHPMPPANAGLALDNRSYLDTMSLRIASETKPVIVAGDLNATLWSGSLKPLLDQKVQWPNGSGIAHSWPAGRPPLAIQIDHVLTKGAKAGSFRMLSPVGSDHLPVRADLVF